MTRSAHRDVAAAEASGRTASFRPYARDGFSGAAVQVIIEWSPKRRRPRTPPPTA